MARVRSNRSRKVLDKDWDQKADLEDILVDFQSDIADRIDRLGIPSPVEAPEDSLEFPEDVTKLGNRNLGRYLSYFTAHLARIIYLVALSESQFLKAKVEYNRAVNYWTFALAPENPRDELKAKTLAHVHTKKQVKSWQDAMVRQEAFLIQLRGLQASYNAYVSALSREITRRDMEGKTAGRV